MAAWIGTIHNFLEKMPLRPDDADNPLRAVLVPSAGDPAALKERFGLEEVYVIYGMTELSGPIADHGPLPVPGSCGKVRAGVEVRLVDEYDIPVPVGAVGELIVRSDKPWEMNMGYYGRPEETAKAWGNGWFHTGDLFRCDEAGHYFFEDRGKDTLRRRGENISSFEVEREVMAYPDVLEAACVAAPGEFGEDEVKVFVVPREKSRFDPKAMINFLSPKMPHFMIPRYVEVIDELPKTEISRVKKYELRSRGNSGSTWDREAARIKVK